MNTLLSITQLLTDYCNGVKVLEVTKELFDEALGDGDYIIGRISVELVNETLPKDEYGCVGDEAEDITEELLLSLPCFDGEVKINEKGYGL